MSTIKWLALALFVSLFLSCARPGEYEILKQQQARISNNLEAGNKQLATLTAEIDKTKSELDATNRQISEAKPRTYREFSSYDELKAWAKAHLKPSAGDSSSLTQARQVQKEAFESGYVVSIGNNIILNQTGETPYKSQVTMTSVSSEADSVELFPTRSQAKDRFYNTTFVSDFVYYWYPEVGEPEQILGFISFPK